MGMFFARSDGLWTLGTAWTRADCPLTAIHFAAVSAGHVAAIDDTAHLLSLDGAVFPCDRDIEALRLWRGYALTLSSNTDCVSVADQDGWLVTARVGMYPQDMCILGADVLVCGGADGLVHRLSLPELLPVRTYPVPGIVLRVHAAGDAAHVLCTTEDGGLCTRYSRLDLLDGRCTHTMTLPGLPGAVCADENGGVWLAASESLYHLNPDGRIDRTIDGFGLIRHMEFLDGTALVTDPLMGVCALVSTAGDVSVLCREENGQAGFIR